MDEKDTVNFFIVGEPKSGTTALASFLGQHPDVCFSNPKEPGYFATDCIEESRRYHGEQLYFAVTTPQQYRNCFAHCRPGSLKGEGSTIYLYSKTAAENIKQYNSNAKIIIMLRNPIDFVYSLHMQYINEGLENEHDFEAALSQEVARKHGEQLPPWARCPSHHLYSERVKYAEQVERFKKRFPPENILVLVTEDFRADNTRSFAQVARFLGIDPTFAPSFEQVHASKTPRSQHLHHLLNHPRFKHRVRHALGPQRYGQLHRLTQRLFLKQQQRTPLSDEVRQRLAASYQPEIEQLSQLLGQDMARYWHDFTADS